MNKKLIITESQYAELKKRLVETPFDELIKTVIKVGDVIEIEQNNKIYLYKVILSKGNKIQMDGISNHIKDFRFNISIDGLNQNKISGKQINKKRNPKLLNDNNLKYWKDFSNIITNFKVKRKKNEIDKADIGTGPTSNQTNNQPNTTNTNTNNQPNTTNTNNQPVLPNGYTEEELVKAVKTNDPILQNLLIRNPNFFERVDAEMKNGRVANKGIIAALKLASEYVEKKLGNGFIPFKSAKYEVLDSPFIDYFTDETSQAQFSRELNREYYATNEKQITGYNYKNLRNKEENYRIKVIEKVEGENDVFKCKFYKFAKLKFNKEPDLYSKPVKIRFLESEGYIPETKQK